MRTVALPLRLILVDAARVLRVKSAKCEGTVESTARYLRLSGEVGEVSGELSESFALVDSILGSRFH